MILLCQIFGTLLKSLDKMFMKISKYHIISVLEAPSLSVIFVVIHTPVTKYIYIESTVYLCTEALLLSMVIFVGSIC